VWSELHLAPCFPRLITQAVGLWVGCGVALVISVYWYTDVFCYSPIKLNSRQTKQAKSFEWVTHRKCVLFIYPCKFLSVLLVLRLRLSLATSVSLPPLARAAQGVAWYLNFDFFRPETATEIATVSLAKKKIPSSVWTLAISIGLEVVPDAGRTRHRRPLRMRWRRPWGGRTPATSQTGPWEWTAV